jgi:hypothetical protein
MKSVLSLLLLLLLLLPPPPNGDVLSSVRRPGD